LPFRRPKNGPVNEKVGQSKLEMRLPVRGNQGQTKLWVPPLLYVELSQKVSRVVNAYGR
jgi:hypothetical protein